MTSKPKDEESKEVTHSGMCSKPMDADIWLRSTAIRGHGTLEGRITPAGERLFYFRYVASNGNRVRLPIGSFSATARTGFLSVKNAMAKANELAALHKSGVRDIREHLEAQEAAAKAVEEAEQARLAAEKAAADAESARLASRRTVSQLFEQWADVELVRHKDGGIEARRMMNQHVIPVIGHLYVADVRKGHVAEVLDPMLTRGTPRMAKVILGKMRQMFRFALERDLIEADPTATFKKSKVGGKDTERDRVLSEDEIRALARQAPGAGMLHTTEAAIWIALSTCCRIGELLAARWEHIDLEAGTWLMPDTKNGKPHTVDLSSFATKQFKIVKAINGTSQWCYPNRDNTEPVCAKTITKQISDRQLADDRKPMSNRSPHVDALKLKGGKWTPHDLRRTGATLMTVLGVLPEVAERCLNHKEENKIKRTYQRHTYINEMREAWRLLGERLELLTRDDADNVVTMKVRER